MSANAPLAELSRDAPDGLKFRPGRTLMGCCVLALLFALVAFWFPPVGWLLVLLILGILVPAFADFQLLKQSFPGASIELKTRPSIGRDLPFEISLNVRLDSYRKVRSRCEVRVDVPRNARPWVWQQAAKLSAGAGNLSKTFRIPDRGKYRFGAAWLRLRGRFGMLEAQRACGDPISIDVLPETFWTAEHLSADNASERQLLERLSRTRQRGVGSEFESLAEFRMGDDPLRIDWRASARQTHLVVRRYQVERHRDLMIVIDCGRLMAVDAEAGSKLDCAVDSALMLARIALRDGDRCGIAAYDDQVVCYVPPLSGINRLKTIVQGVYDLKTNYREPNFGEMFETLQSRQRKRSMVIVLSDLVSDTTSNRFRASLLALAKRHLVLLVAIRSPMMSEIVRKPVESTEQAARQAVTFRLLRDRHRVIHGLSNSAIHVLDVEPQDLTVDLLNHFIELRTTKLV